MTGRGGNLEISESPLSERASTGPRKWAFGPALLDEQSLQLFVDGRPVFVERKPLEVLLYLLHHAGTVVTKKELIATLWSGRPLCETVLSRCVSVLRQALGDRHHRIIRTAHRVGYRLALEPRVDSCCPYCGNRFSAST
jgi:DNA-binding winged helix-turn-helix (wHTH) protein